MNISKKKKVFSKSVLFQKKLKKIENSEKKYTENQNLQKKISGAHIASEILIHPWKRCYFLQRFQNQFSVNSNSSSTVA